MHSLINRLAVSVLVLSTSAMCHASVEIGASRSGWYSSAGTYNLNGNYAVRLGDLRNFFVFDLSGVTSNILSATLRLDHSQEFDFQSPAVYTMYDVSTSISSLLAPPAVVSSIYGDLGSGVTYGSHSVSGIVAPGVIEITLTSAAVSAMNSASGLFAIGGALTSQGTSSAQLFGGTGFASNRTLVLEVEQPVTDPNVGVVPEPVSAVVWAGIAIAGCVGISFRKRKTLFSSC